MKNQLLTKIHNHTAVVAVIGLGYVGLPLAVADCAAVTDHASYDWAAIREWARVLVDTRHAIGEEHFVARQQHLLARQTRHRDRWPGDVHNHRVTCWRPRRCRSDGEP